MDDEHLLQPFRLVYRGNDADRHRLDAVEAGRSIVGTARLYNSALHFAFHGQVPARNYRPCVRTYARAPEHGCLEITLLAGMVYDQINTYPQVLQKCIEFIFPKLLKAIFAKRTGQSAEMMKALEIIHDQSKQNSEVAQSAIGAIAADKAELYRLVDKLTTNNRASMAKMASPVGYSCRTLTHFDNSTTPVVVDEPLAEAMRSQEELEVGAQTEIEGMILGVDKVTGTCRIRLPDTGTVVRGKITDPALQSTHNVYTAALDTDTRIVLTAKPILKDGEISRLYISDARSMRVSS